MLLHAAAPPRHWSPWSAVQLSIPSFIIVRSSRRSLLLNHSPKLALLEPTCARMPRNVSSVPVQESKNRYAVEKT